METSTTRGTTSRGANAAGRRGGFTLIELLVVMGIILALMGLLLPAINEAYRQGIRSRMAADIQAISTALEAYKGECGDYPRVNSPGGQGAAILGWALLAPSAEGVDGADGYGFRVRKPITTGGVKVQQSKVYGPYLPPDKFKMNGTKILDKYGQPILYYPGNPTANIQLPNGYVAPGAYGAAAGAKPMFNASDNDSGNFIDPHNMPATAFQSLMGVDPVSGKLINTATGAATTPPYVGPFILWSSGPDTNFGPEDRIAAQQAVPPRSPDLIPSPKNRCDDVANFPRGETSR